MNIFPKELHYKLTHKDLFISQITVLKCSFSRPFMKVMNIGIFLFLFYAFYSDSKYGSLVFRVGLAFGITVMAIISWCVVMLVFVKFLGSYQYKAYKTISFNIKSTENCLNFRNNIVEVNFPYHQLEKVFHLKNGIVLRFSQLSYLHIPEQAFDSQKSKDDWENFLNSFTK